MVEMRLLSSRYVFFRKRFLAWIWVPVLLLVYAGPFIQAGHVPPLSFLLSFYLIPTIFVLVALPAGYFIIRKTVLNTVDEVLDADDALVIRNRKQEERIALSDIMNISYSPYLGVQRVTLTLRRPSTF